MVLMSQLVSQLLTNICYYLCKSTILNKIWDLTNLVYSKYIAPLKIYDRTVRFLTVLLQTYVWQLSVVVFNKFLDINSELANNTQSELVKDKMNNKYSDAKNYLIETVVHRYFIKPFEDVFTNNNMLLLEDTAGISCDKQYKRNLITDSIMSNNLLDNEDLDDLDEQLDLSNVPDVPKEQIEEAEKIEQEIHASEKPISRQAKKLAAKKGKAAERRAAAGRNPGKNMPNLMNMPGMNEMMEAMLKEDNLEKIMKQLPKSNQSGIRITPAETEKMKQFIRDMNKK